MAGLYTEADYENSVVELFKNICSTPMIGQSPATQTWTPIRKTWKSSKADGSKRQGKIGSKR